MSDGIIGEAWFEEIEGFASVSASALAVYEYLLTIEHDVSIFWQRKWTATSLMFLANRLLLTTPNVIRLVFAFVPYIKANSMGVLIQNQVFILSSMLLVALLTALRTSALWNFNRALFLVIFILSAAPFAANMYAQTVSSWGVEVDPLTGQQQYTQVFNVSEHLNMIMLYVSRVPPIVADFLVLVFTWMRTYRQLRDARQFGIKLSVSTCLARDGSVYFVVIFIINLLRLLISDVPALLGLSPIDAFVVTVPQILLQRFLINLRQLNEAERLSSTTDPSLRSVVFNRPNFNSRRMGNIGESLGYVEEDEEWSEYFDGNANGNIELIHSQRYDMQDAVSDAS